MEENLKNSTKRLSFFKKKSKLVIITIASILILISIILLTVLVSRIKSGCWEFEDDLFLQNSGGYKILSDSKVCFHDDCSLREGMDGNKCHLHELLFGYKWVKDVDVETFAAFPWYNLEFDKNNLFQEGEIYNNGLGNHKKDMINYCWKNYDNLDNVYNDPERLKKICDIFLENPNNWDK